MPDLNAPFIISCDGSSFGLGAVLSQENNGVRYPIWFASRSLGPPLSNQGSSVLELAAVNWAVRKFSHFIEYSKFTLETDHSAILWLKKMNEPTVKLARWLFELQHYDYEVQHRAGTSMVMKVLDALSRMEENFHMEIDTSLCRKSTLEEQLKDQFICHVRNHLVNDNMNEEIYQAQKNRNAETSNRSFIAVDGVLHRYVGPKNKPWEYDESYWRIWLPSALVLKALAIFHDSLNSGHFGIRKTYLRVEDKLFWTEMRK